MREINQSINQRLFTFINPFDETIMHSFSISVKCHLNGIGSRDIIEINIEFMNKCLEATKKVKRSVELFNNIQFLQNNCHYENIKQRIEVQFARQEDRLKRFFSIFHIDRIHNLYNIDAPK